MEWTALLNYDSNQKLIGKLITVINQSAGFLQSLCRSRMELPPAGWKKECMLKVRTPDPQAKTVLAVVNVNKCYTDPAWLRYFNAALLKWPFSSHIRQIYSVFSWKCSVYLRYPSWHHAQIHNRDEISTCIRLQGVRGCVSSYQAALPAFHQTAKGLSKFIPSDRNRNFFISQREK